jgi:glycosyltransferase involved in cell wall biosynthesis
MSIIGIEAARPNRPQKTGTEWYGFHVIQEMKKIADPSEDQFILYTNNPLHSGLEKMPNDAWREKKLKWPLPRFWTQGRLSLEMVIDPPDILFIPAHAMPVVHPKKSVVTLHDVGFERYPELYPKTDLWYHRWSAKFVINQASTIITVSEFSKQELIDLYNAPAEKIKVTHLGYDAEHYRPIDNREKIQAVLDKYKIKKPYIFNIGRIDKKKNILLLIEAFGRFKKQNPDDPHRLVLVGRYGFGFDRGRLAGLIKKYNLSEWVIETGWVDEADVPYLYNGATCYVFPSCYEGFGIPLLEAMATETPILASRGGSIPEVTGDAALFFETREVHSLVENLTKILSDKKLQSDLVTRGRERVKQFSWEKTARQTLEILKS